MKKLKKPTFINLTLGIIIPEVISFLIKQSEVAIPTKIQGYQLVKEIKKKEMFREYRIGIYESKGKRVLIKTWSGRIKDFRYYSLVYEYLIGKIFIEKLRSSPFFVKVRVPQVIKYIKSKNSLSIIFEFINGKNLSEFPVEKQAEVLVQIINILEKISESFSKEDYKQFPSRTFMFYIISLPLFGLMTIASNVKSWKVICRAFLSCILLFKKTLISSPLFIAHRDLDPKNIILKGKYIYIVDCGRTVLTLPNFDITYLSLEPQHKAVINIVLKKLKKNINKFLEQYILIQFAKSYGNPTSFDNFYLKKLWRRYG